MKTDKSAKRIRRIATVAAALFAVASLTACRDFGKDPGLKRMNARVEKRNAEIDAAAAKEATEKSGEVLFMEDGDEPPKGKQVEIFRVGNDQGVQNGGTAPAFSMDKKYWVTEVWTYHWNGGSGTAAGTIALKAADGKTYGPWDAQLDNGVYWVAKPKTYIPAGSYTVIDSNPATLAQNAGTGGQGMAWMEGIPAGR